MQRTVFVNVYAISSHYGGAEEGGWEYESGSPVLTKATTCICAGLKYDGDEQLWGKLLGSHGEHCPAGHWREILRSRYSGEAGWAESFTHSSDGESWLESSDDVPEPFAGETMREGRCTVEVESHPGEVWPTHRPHYE
tara:strand:+ start:245 stop:658 length:414 start_codon:yes stop_codon:yes gene_type:complete